MAGDTDRHTIGLISDTHGLLRPGVHSALDGVELILHAGDVGGDEILHELGAIAPVLAVQGNTDPGGHPALPRMQVLAIGGLRIHVSHGDELGVPNPVKLLAAYDADIIVYGHTHRPLVERSGDRLVVNPGSAGARRFKLTPSVARMTITDRFAEVDLVDID